MVLPRELQRRLDRLRAAGDEIDTGQIAGRMGREQIGQRLGGLAGEEAGVGEGEPVELGFGRRCHVGVAVPETGDGGAAGAVEIALAGGIDEVAALARHRGLHGGARMAREDMAHQDILPGSNPARAAASTSADTAAALSTNGVPSGAK